MLPTGHVRLQIAAHGQYQTSVDSFDLLLSEFISGALPQSVDALRAELQRVSDEEFGHGLDFSDLSTVTECLLIFAELRGLATN
ncbi:hypothetical protein phiHau3_71 [Streptomyces phage phiHau3]|uniref:Uncharacterized protein n=1 Tax=Streptomyces phage phiHau3 TaxID=1204524 RepID=K4IB54_9CAUD|nr:hypothetical protein phiHau3_71 [Streptomyces phage phiHau3]AFU62049.1 hypothetical protein phiHau3_71 [Streptomyces phage phiHau3]